MADNVENTLLFINTSAVKLDELFLEDTWSCQEFFPNIYHIIADGKKLNWIVKTYSSRLQAEIESKNLRRLKRIKGVPQLLSIELTEKSENSLNYVIMSLATGVDLYEYQKTAKKSVPMTEEELKPIAKQLFELVRKIHLRGVIHQDIKPENIIYDSETGKITLIDFEEKMTDEFCSPEQIKGKKLTKKTDVWSIGLTLYNLACGEVLFKNRREILGKPIIFPKNFSFYFSDFLSCLIVRELYCRYDVDEALEHPWLYK